MYYLKFATLTGELSDLEKTTSFHLPGGAVGCLWPMAADLPV